MSGTVSGAGNGHRRAVRRLVLFDIDGTLLASAGAGRRAMEASLLVAFGTHGASHYRFDGKTDRQIVRELMRGEGFDDATIDHRMDAVMREYLERLEGEVDLPSAPVRALPGVIALLDALADRADLAVGLLTGNIEPGAHRKLGAAGIAPHRFCVGAYGSDHEERDALAAVAQRRAREVLGLELPGEALVVIGDTPSDIRCARPVGARAIGVATGHYGVEELRAHEPAAVLADLVDTFAVLQAIDDA